MVHPGFPRAPIAYDWAEVRTLQVSCQGSHARGIGEGFVVTLADGRRLDLADTQAVPLLWQLPILAPLIAGATGAALPGPLMSSRARALSQAAGRGVRCCNDGEPVCGEGSAGTR